MQFLFALLTFLAACLPALGNTPPAFSRGEEPEWVEVLPLLPVDEPKQAQAQDGVHYILSDRQIRWEGKEQVSYARTVSKVTDRVGLERAATISFDYTPEFDRIVLTRLVIIRDGQEIDLRDTLHEEVLRREQRLDQGIIDGSLTAWMQIPDLRVGDVIDTSSLRIMKPLAPEGDRAVVSIWIGACQFR